MTISSKAHPQALSVETLPLSGIHLIEASAGTGKTYNITRIYLRLIIEQGLDVQQILVMTYTNAATQELRGRITETLQLALRFWTDPQTQTSNGEPVLSELYSRIDSELAQQRIRLAILHMDEAAIFTIHGFCQRMLQTMAFDTASPVSMTLQQDHSALVEQAVADWFRLQQRNDVVLESLASSGWHTPDAFLKTFYELIFTTEELVVVTETDIQQDFEQKIAKISAQLQPTLQAHYQHLKSQQPIIWEDLIASQKTRAAQESREEEWQVLLDWLATGDVIDIPKAVGDFLNGRRYSSRPNSKAILLPLADERKNLIKKVSALQDKRQKLLEESRVYQHVADAVQWIRHRIAEQKRKLGEMGFNDLISNMAKSVTSSADFAARLSEQFPAALVDEFQDTDTHQYQMLQAIYVSPKNVANSTRLLMMIGDPKQAIYGFRGGDIFTYLKARSDADYLWLMDTNWRSVAEMVNAYNHVFDGHAISGKTRAVFGENIHYERVNSTESSAAAARPLSDPYESQRGAITYIYANQQDESLTEAQAKPINKQKIAAWCSIEIQRLLATVKIGEHPLNPSDIAILVRDWREAELISNALRQVNLNAVYLSDKTPLFASLEALELLRVFDGVWHYQRDSLVITALSTSLLNTPVHVLHQMQADPLADDWTQQRSRIVELRKMWQEQGVLAFIFSLLRHDYQPDAMSERALTNFVHLAEVLQQLQQRSSHPLQLIQWLREQINQPDISEAYQQRLESDAQLIKIVTQHKSKGLEYPIVFVPFANEYSNPTKRGNSSLRIYNFFDPTRNKRICQLGQTQNADKWVTQQSHEETVRLLYVAITRAEYRCYLGVYETQSAHDSALGIALGMHDSQCDSWQALLRHQHTHEKSHAAMLSADDTPQEETLITQSEESAPLRCRQFNGKIQRDWRLHSFSGLTRMSHTLDVTTREVESTSIEAVLSAQSEEGQADAFRFSFEKGASAGNLLHDVLELADFSHADWPELCHQVAPQYGPLLKPESFGDMADWLSEVVQTPVIQNHSGQTIKLCDLAQHQTLREAEFYFPLDKVDLTVLRRVLEQHRQQLVDDGRLMSSYANASDFSLQRSLRGMMHGFIDLIFEVDGRYYVADYKSTHLGNELQNYQPHLLAANNAEHLYDLQYLIYATALHRYLKVTLTDYDFDTHFGGVSYLYLRGMHPGNVQGEGVFSCQLNAETIITLDDLFAGRLKEVNVSD
ncbi:exodeoxyribonuclease V subunit beta [Alteromonas facilis]|uniref:exodeoxyribonuclease V subunit beta n=1 Tax=Alteromonas facilis TaxID=2048004 RepID=UPI000C291660|nr:exodeoxyribonuclease V subunit beta [Alteromonas facilis]